MGEYLGLQKGKWDRALPLLAKSKGDLADLARRDVAEPKDGKDPFLYWAIPIDRLAIHAGDEVEENK